MFGEFAAAPSEPRRWASQEQGEFFVGQPVLPPGDRLEDFQLGAAQWWHFRRRILLGLDKDFQEWSHATSPGGLVFQGSPRLLERHHRF